MKVSIFSLKGGVGKTFLSVNLATFLAYYLNKKVLLLDLNKDNANSFVYIDFRPKFENAEEFWQGINVTPYKFHLAVQNSFDTKSLAEKLDRALPVLEKYYDYILFDSPTRYRVIETIAKRSDINLLVTTPDYMSLYSNAILYKKLVSSGIDPKTIKLVLNKDDQRFDPSVYEMVFGKPLFATIPFDNLQKKSELVRIPIVFLKRNSKSSKAISHIVEYLTGERINKSILETLKAIFML